MAPDDLIDHVVRFVDLIGNAIVVDIEGSIITPVVALPSLGPLDIARTDILHLGAIIDEGIGVNFVLFRSSGEMYTDLALLERVAADLVKVGVVDKHTLLGTDDAVTGNFRIVGRIEKQAAFAVVRRIIIFGDNPIRKHDRKTDVIVE